MVSFLFVGTQHVVSFLLIRIQDVVILLNIIIHRIQKLTCLHFFTDLFLNDFSLLVRMNCSYFAFCNYAIVPTEKISSIF